MPPEVKITKDMLLDRAFVLTREKGFEAVTARKLARELACSTQPIFRLYANMDSLKKDLTKKSWDYFDQYIESAYESKDPLLDISLTYINFALKERHLFEMMFMSEDVGENTFDGFFSDIRLDSILNNGGYARHLTPIERRVVFMQMWIFAHGIASMVVTNNVSMDHEDIVEIMNNTLIQLLS